MKFFQKLKEKATTPLWRDLVPPTPAIPGMSGGACIECGKGIPLYCFDAFLPREDQIKSMTCKQCGGLAKRLPPTPMCSCGHGIGWHQEHHFHGIHRCGYNLRELGRTDTCNCNHYRWIRDA